MSQVQQLKDQIAWFAQQAKSTADQLQTYQMTFDQAVADVQAMIGGSAQGADKNILGTIEEAKRKLDEAVKTVQHAASEASNYGDSL